MEKLPAFSDRVLNYLWDAERRERNGVWYQDDIRCAWITTLYAARGYRNPFVLATFRVFGIHPDRLQAAIEARLQAQQGSYYLPIGSPEARARIAHDRSLIVQMSSGLPPKKPCASVRPEVEPQRKIS